MSDFIPTARIDLLSNVVQKSLTFSQASRVLTPVRCFSHTCPQSSFPYLHQLIPKAWEGSAGCRNSLAALRIRAGSSSFTSAEHDGAGDHHQVPSVLLCLLKGSCCFWMLWMQFLCCCPLHPITFFVMAIKSQRQLGI